jgi:hypothetical protein
VTSRDPQVALRVAAPSARRIRPRSNVGYRASAGTGGGMGNRASKNSPMSEEPDRNCERRAQRHQRQHALALLYANHDCPHTQRPPIVGPLPSLPPGKTNPAPFLWRQIILHEEPATCATSRRTSPSSRFTSGLAARKTRDCYATFVPTPRPGPDSSPSRRAASMRLHA